MAEITSIKLFKTGRKLLIYLIAFVSLLTTLVAIADIDELNASQYISDPLSEKLIYVFKDVYIFGIVILLLITSFFLARRSPLFVGAFILIMGLIASVLLGIDIASSSPLDSSDTVLFVCVSLFFLPLLLCSFLFIRSGLIRRRNGLPAGISRATLVQYRENQKSIAQRKPYKKLDFQSMLNIGIGGAFILAGLCLVSITMAGRGSGTSETSPDSFTFEGGMQVSVSVLGIGLFFVASGISRQRKLRKKFSHPVEVVQPRKPMDISSQALKAGLPENLIGSVALTSQPDVKPRIGPREIIFLAVCVTLLLALVAIGVLLAFN